MRFMTYSHDSCGLGHLRRTFVISNELAERIPDATVLSLIGSNHGSAYFKPQNRRHDYVKLPGVQKTNGGEYQSRHLPLEFSDLIELRTSILSETIRAFRPDMLIVDKNPHGLGGELIPALQRLRAERPEAKIVLGLRDILDDPARVLRDWTDPKYTSWVDRTYDALWIWGDPEVFDAASVYGFPAPIRAKTRYLGYLPPEPAKSDPNTLRIAAGVKSARERLLLMTGGGGGDALPKFLVALEGFERAAAPNVRVFLVAGPLMSAEDCELLEGAARKFGDRVRIVRFLERFEDWIRAADAVVCMGGYNTMREVAALGKPALALPRTEPRIEQSLRARTFSSRGWCEYPGDDSDPAAAVAGFCERLDGGRLAPSLVTLPCRGLAAMLDEVNSLLAPEEAGISAGARA